MNTLGTLLRLTTFGESHGPAMGGILDGMPPKVFIDRQDVQAMIDRRRTGRDPLTSQRKETDIPEYLSGISPEGFTIGTPIGFIFRNSDAHSSDYGELEHRFRPNHADYTYQVKYGIRDHRGGGRASARETVNWVMGGAIAMQWLKTLGISIGAHLSQVGKEETLEGMREIVEKVRADRDSIGGKVTCTIKGLPAGLGNPVFGKFQARLAEAMMSLNAVKAFEFGVGSSASGLRGSEMIDEFQPGFIPEPLYTNYNGGTLGGITSGMPVYFNLHFKPTPTIPRSLPMPDENGEMKDIIVGGRHDPCVAMRAPVIVEALAALTVADMLKMEGYGYNHKDCHESMV